MITDIFRELKQSKGQITRKQVLAWARRVEAQRTQKALIEDTKENKDFGAMKKQEQKNDTLDKTKSKRREMCITYKYCGST